MVSLDDVLGDTNNPPRLQLVLFRSTWMETLTILKHTNKRNPRKLNTTSAQNLLEFLFHA